MPHRHDKNRYALAVGHIAIEWNYLERDLQRIAHAYLAVDEEITAHIFAYMGNASRAEFTGWLAERDEQNDVLQSHIKHFMAVFRRLRANRNIVEHGVPALTRDGAFLGEIIKLDRRSGDMPFAASQAALDTFLKDLREARAFADSIQKAQIGEQSPDRIIKPAMPIRMTATAQRNSEH